MTLKDLLGKLDSLDEEATIIATMPWTPSSPAQVVASSDDGSIAAMERDGMSYFLEVSIVRELREDLPHLGSDAFCNRVILYATNDA